MMEDSGNVKTLKPGMSDVSSLAANSRRQIEDNPLLEALTLVIESNAEYARGVTTMLDADLEREVALVEIKKETTNIKKILDQHTETLTSVLTQVSKTKEKLDSLEDLLDEKITDKLSPLYVVANLQTDGSQYNPTDKLVVTFQKVLSSKIFTMVAGIAIWVLVKFLYEGIK